MSRTLSKYILTVCILALVTPVLNHSNVISGQTFKHTQGVVATMGTPPEGLKTDYKTKADDPRLDDGVTLQRTHEYVHDIYIRPGESTVLEPFSDFHSANESSWGYKYTYNRWYDYRTDKNSDRLSSASGDYKSVAFAGKGYWGGSALSGLGVSHRYSGSRINYKAPNTNDSIFDIIAIEVSNSATSSIYVSKSTTLTEPTLQFRHIFVIHNAQKLADEMTASIDANREYIEKTKIKLMCPEGTPFQYPLPNNEYRGWGSSAKPTGYYYKNGSEYTPIYHYRIEFLKADGTVIGSTTDGKAYNASGAAIGNSLNKKVSSTPRNDNEKTTCDRMQTNLVYTYKCIEGYDRVLYLKKPEVGKYIIRIYAINAESADKYTDIKISGQNLLLQEYELEVLPATEAAMLTEDELKQDKYKNQRPAMMRELYGEPAVEIDFDEIKSSDCELNKTGDGYYKWPREWENSSYAFGYSERYDYNMYVVANRSSAVPYRINDNMYDRLYADTGGKQKGFFYYTNAASDPGRMALLDVGNDMCTNTRIYVSAWVCEMNNNYEAANIVFSFRGVKEDGSETVLSSYVTGYVIGGMNTKNGFVNSKTPDKNNDFRGQWMHVYYSFMPSIVSSEFDHYVITLENNCTSSEGADYAIDDIECYVRTLAIQAKQDKPVCLNNKETELQFSVDFDQLINAFLIPEATSADKGEEKSLYYCYLVKSKFESVYLEKGDYKAAFDSALVRNSYGVDSPETYGVMKFNTYFGNNTETKVVGSSRSLLFSTEIVDSLMRYNGTYMLAMVNPDLVEGAPDAYDFDILGACSNVSEFPVIFSGEITIDGDVSKTLSGVEVCANQKPVVQINLNAINQSADTTQHIKAAYFDWFLGSQSAYEGSEYNDQPLVDALVEFRAAYPKVSQSDFAKTGTTTKYTAAMKACIQHFIDAKTLKLYLNSSYISLDDQYKEDILPGEKRKYYLTAIPINPTPDVPDLKYCLEPLEIVAHLSADTPTMLDGDDHDIIQYPVAMRDVPLRIGLEQLRICSNLEITEGGNISAPSGKMLYVPLREVHPVTTGVTKLKKSVADDYVYLAATNDPALIGESGKILSVGRVSYITATKDDTENVCAMAFLKNFNFREGYEYTLKFHFDEDNKDATAHVCSGDVILSLKIVPEYQMWTGAASRNWNDDANWRRVTRAELFNPTTDVVGNDFVTDGGTNDNTKSYVPADFTKVIIPEGEVIPYMYNLRTEANLEEVPFVVSGKSYYIVSMATGNDEIADVPKIQYDPELEEYACISEDMSSVEIDGGVACRTWYDHTCEQIHFMSGSEMMDQRYLYYQKAWMDLELDTARWHTVALPLINVVAGDFYAPTDGARQNTPLFQDINYSTDLNDRFAPAVFQRSWNAANAKVVNIDGSTDDSAVKLDWSFVYNDVNVNYNSGIGFSVKPDVSRLSEEKKPATVKFRFPKADVSYTYYNPENADGGNAEDVRPAALVEGKRVGRLIDATADYSVELGNYTDKAAYFLVGNPFVCHLNMKEFFKVNTGLKAQYWIVTAAGQRAAVMSSDTDGFVSTIDDAAMVAPGVSFFVELKEGTANNYSVKFTSAMMTYPKEEETGGLVSNNNGQLRISATDKSGFKTMLILADGESCKISGAEALFDSNLSDKPMLYASIDGQAMTISEIASESRIPIGLSGNGAGIELCFEYASSFDMPLFVYDAQTGQSQPLYSGITLSQSGSGVRYYLVTERQMNDGASASLPSILVEKGRMIVEIAGDYEFGQVSVFSTAGNCVADAVVSAGQCGILLESGVYVVRVRCDDSEYDYKISIP